MNLYLAGDCYLKQILQNKKDDELAQIYLLRTFASKEPWFFKYYTKLKDVILDSGAFTFMAGADVSKIDWDEYIERYAQFIKETGVKHFIELDIDVIVGYEEVKRLRKKLVLLTNRQPIPVWHKTRGKDEFIKMCQEFDYVALGGFAIKNWTKKDFKYIPWFIKTAHDNKTKIHGLGFTYCKELKKYHFDSVDSSSWTIGNRFGCVSQFRGNGTIKNHARPIGTRIPNEKQLALATHNFNEWLKMQRYAEEVL